MDLKKKIKKMIYGKRDKMVKAEQVKKKVVR